jgi:hypothetical protein
MEQEFRTTFIPKKPIVPQPASSTTTVSKPVGIIFTISLIIFIMSILISGGVYFYKSYLEKEVADLSSSLETLQRNIDPNVIKEFSVMDKRLKNAEVLLNQHTVLSSLFTVLRSTTLPTVRYTKLDMSFSDSRDLQITMSGESDGYRSIALQSQALAKNANLKNTIFSNFVVTPKGRVAFDVSFMIPSADLAFAKNLDSFSGPMTTTQDQVVNQFTNNQVPSTDVQTTTESITQTVESNNFDNTSSSVTPTTR